MRIVMIGGTFNPPHNGHLRLIREVLEAFGYEKAVLVPAFVPPHKEVAGGIPAETRLALTRLAIRGRTDAVVDDREIARGGISWTIDTIDSLSEQYGCARPGLVIGDDHVPIFHTWKDPDLLASRADLIVVRRNGIDVSDFRWPHRYLDLEPDCISSARIRELCSRGETVRVSELVPEAVFDYIRREGLYGAA